MSLSLWIAYLACFALICVFFLSLRWPILENFFQGFDRVLDWHHHFVWLFVCLSSIHIAIEIEPYLETFWSDLFFTEDLVLQFGFLVSVLFFTVVFFSYFKKLKRSRWLFIHRLSYLGLVILGFHLLSVRKTFILEDALAKNSLFLLYIFSGISVFVLGLIHSYAPHWIYPSEKIVVINRKNLGIFTVLRLKFLDPKRKWHGGEFGFFRFLCHGSCGVSKEYHPFSISAADDESVELIIKSVGDDSHCLENLEIGTQGQVLGPYGRLMPLKGQDHVWIAGGLGIVPFLGLLQRFSLHGFEGGSVILLVLHRDTKLLPWIEKMRDLESQLSWLKIYDYEDTDEKRFSFSDFNVLIPFWKKAEIAISGPKLMVKIWRKNLLKAGCSKRHLHTEDFMI